MTIEVAELAGRFFGDLQRNGQPIGVRELEITQYHSTCFLQIQAS